MEDVKEKYSQKIVAEKIKEQKIRKEIVIIKEISKKQKSNWRKDLHEGMTSSNAFATTIAPVKVMELLIQLVQLMLQVFSRVIFSLVQVILEIIMLKLKMPLQ